MKTIKWKTIKTGWFCPMIPDEIFKKKGTFCGSAWECLERGEHKKARIQVEVK